MEGEIYKRKKRLREGQPSRRTRARQERKQAAMKVKRRGNPNVMQHKRVLVVTLKGEKKESSRKRVGPSKRVSLRRCCPTKTTTGARSMEEKEREKKELRLEKKELNK